MVITRITKKTVVYNNDYGAFLSAGNTAGTICKLKKATFGG